MSHLLNLAGFGIVAWDKASANSQLPYFYKTQHLPFYDENLRNLVKKITPYCMLSHIRGVPYNSNSVVSNQNVHPFMFEGTNIALAHNGELFGFNEMKYDLLPHIKPIYQNKIKGTTDSEWIYAVFISQLPHESHHYETHEIIDAIMQTLKILQQVRHKHNLRTNSPVNIFITNGDFIAATRFVFDYGWQELGEEPTTHSAYHSLWYTYGETYGFYENAYRMTAGDKRSSIILASEPLTEDVTTWIEVPEYTLMVARLQNGEINIVSQDINL
jgi:glutamine amidotransferase